MFQGMLFGAEHKETTELENQIEGEMGKEEMEALKCKPDQLPGALPKSSNYDIEFNPLVLQKQFDEIDIEVHSTSVVRVLIETKSSKNQVNAILFKDSKRENQVVTPTSASKKKGFLVQLDK